MDKPPIASYSEHTDRDRGDSVCRSGRRNFVAPTDACTVYFKLSLGQGMATKLPKIALGHGKTHIGSIFLGGIFDDGGGIIISPTKFGGVVVTHVPPREPVTGELTPLQSVLVDAKIDVKQITDKFKISMTAGQEVVDGIGLLSEA